MNRWEADEGYVSEVDSQARADVAHAERRVIEACRRMCGALPPEADLIHDTLEADLEPKAAAAVLDYLRELVGLLDVEIRANVLGLPRE
ncbi:MAG TPA: hypothetical protein VIJ20_00915, partial [Solirubrobacteraceae bacterium]